MGQHSFHAVSPTWLGLAQAPGDELLPLGLGSHALGLLPGIPASQTSEGSSEGEWCEGSELPQGLLKPLEWGGKAKRNVCAKGSACCLSPVLC